jgi:hypothetical protein
MPTGVRFPALRWAGVALVVVAACKAPAGGPPPAESAVIEPPASSSAVAPASIAEPLVVDPALATASSGPVDAGGPFPILAAPILRAGATKVTGKLPPEVIQRIVRQNFGRFRICYESGLRRNPTLKGRVTTRFLIGTDGDVPSSVDAGSDLPDEAVLGCIRRSFRGLSFPTPASGEVTVVYLLNLEPGDPKAHSKDQADWH